MQDRIKAVLLPIISAEFPDELDEFEEYADGFIQLALRNDIFQGSEKINHCEFFPADVQTNGSSFSFLMGTIKAFLELKKMSKTKDKQFLQHASERWASHLMSFGFNYELAKAIATEYSGNLRQLLFYAE